MSNPGAPRGPAGDYDHLLRVLLVEDSPSDAAVIEDMLEGLGTPIEVRWTQTLAHGCEALAESTWSCVLVDLGLPDSDGIDTVDEIVRAAPDVPVIVLTGRTDKALGEVAVRHGAQDYLSKGATGPELLGRSVRYAVERKRVQDRIQRSEERFHAASDNLIDAFAIFAAVRDDAGRVEDFRVDYVNEAACAVHQLRPEDQLGARLLDVLPQYGTTGLFERYVSVVETGVPVETEVSWPDATGAGRVLDVRASRFGEAVVAVLRDVTERILAERALVAANSEVNRALSRLNAVVDAAPLAIIEVDAGEQVTLWSSGAERMFGWTNDQVLGRPCPVMPTSEQPAFAAPRPATWAGRAVAGKEERCRRKDGTLMDAALYTAPVRSPEGDVDRTVGVFVDVTESKRLSAELAVANDALAARAQDLERSNEDLSAFAYVVSHDLGEPLRTISGFADLLTEELQGKLSADAERFVGHINEGTARMRNLLDGLLAYSRARSSTQALEAVDLGEVAAEVLANMHATIEATGATVTITPLPTITADRTQMVQLLQNLASNAVKFVAPDVAPVVEIGARRDDDSHWLITVADNGVGVDPASRAQVFELFRRLVPRTRYAGVGAGLAICRRIVERHGGRVWIEDNTPGGSRFCVRVPAGPDLTAGPDGRT